MQLLAGKEGSQSWKSWLEASSLLAAILYAFGWIFTARVLARFDVTPEEVGFNFAFLLVRVVFLVLSFVAVVILVILGLNKLAQYSGATRIELVPAQLLKGIAFILLIAIGRYGPPWVAAAYRAVSNILLIVATGLTIFTFMLFLITLFVRAAKSRFSRTEEVEAESTGHGDDIAVRPGVHPSSATAESIEQQHRDEEPAAGEVEPQAADSAQRSLATAEDSGGKITFSLRTAFRLISYLLALTSIVALLAVPILAADQYADRIEDGRELRAPVLPGISGFVVQRVQATSTDAEPISPRIGRSECVHLFGSANGTIVIYDNNSQSVIRVAQGRVSLEHPCR
jgi:hypothetical protein